jgi:Flp pilus assembly protein TadB
MLARKSRMPYSDWTKIISASVGPVVIISACGLLCLAFYNRLAAIVSRLRGFQRERLREQELLSHPQDATAQESARRERLLDHLETQTLHVGRRAKLIRQTLVFLLLAISTLICCCVVLGLSILLPQVIFLAVVLFILGLLLMLGGIISALMELQAALQPAELESRFVTQVIAEEHHHSGDSA